MQLPKKYLAASVPRFLRTSRLSYVPLSCVIGSRLIEGPKGANLYLDIIMLPANEFQRMRTNVGLQHVVSPGLKADVSFNPGFVLADTKQIIVPEGEPNPEEFARNYFMIQFDLITPEALVENPSNLNKESSVPNREASFSRVAKEYTSIEKS